MGFMHIVATAKHLIKRERNCFHTVFSVTVPFASISKVYVFLLGPIDSFLFYSIASHTTSSIPKPTEIGEYNAGKQFWILQIGKYALSASR